MTTTDLINLLQKMEFGASGRPRNVSFSVHYKNGRSRHISDPEIKFHSSGDGICGAQLCLSLKEE